LYKLRKEKVERSFADSKQSYGFRYAMYKGIEKNQNYTWLICAAKNMKNIAKKLTNAATLLILNTAWNVLARGRRCAIVLKYSIVCLLFCKG